MGIDQSSLNETNHFNEWAYYRIAWLKYDKSWVVDKEGSLTQEKV